MNWNRVFIKKTESSQQQALPLLSARPVVTFLVSLHHRLTAVGWYQFIWLVEQRHVCKQLASSLARCLTAKWQGIEPANDMSLVHYPAYCASTSQWSLAYGVFLTWVVFIHVASLPLRLHWCHLMHTLLQLTSRNLILMIITVSIWY